MRAHVDDVPQGDRQPRGRIDLRVGPGAELDERAIRGAVLQLTACPHALDLGLFDGLFDVDLEIVDGELEATGGTPGADDEADSRGVRSLRPQGRIALQTPVARIRLAADTERVAVPEDAAGPDLLPVVQLAEVRGAGIARLTAANAE